MKKLTWEQFSNLYNKYADMRSKGKEISIREFCKQENISEYDFRSNWEYLREMRDRV